jgi:hypothetical protein
MSWEEIPGLSWYILRHYPKISLEELRNLRHSKKGNPVSAMKFEHGYLEYAAGI